MRSVRLDETLEARLAEAAAREGVTESEFIREAIAERCDAVLNAPSLYDRARDLVGTVRSEGGRAEQADEVMAELLRRDFERQKARRPRQSAAS